MDPGPWLRLPSRADILVFCPSSCSRLVPATDVRLRFLNHSFLLKVSWHNPLASPLAFDAFILNPELYDGRYRT